ncbi:glycine zipper 2TM domain-containing protein [Sulfuriferula nivalis]|uniref:Membrane protein n=1 Tax=Sulfuriferula nivalis TaxID=2675298 RepID=A0A809RHR2_9PROT|nr:glycine zipper 2TM domain-containing protein [Sulfuriferula nivalis]BBP00384.1 membrane protein [Sulfuriferula nivalis]
MKTYPLKKSIAVFALLTATALTAGCASTYGTNGVGSGDYNSQQARQSQDVQLGTVLSTRAVNINTTTNTSQTAGAGIGALLGGLAGNQVGNGTGKTIATVLGALGGGVAGNAVEHQISNQRGIEITVKLDNGQLRAISQAVDGETFRVGDHVQVIGGMWGGVMRVTH